MTWIRSGEGTRDHPAGRPANKLRDWSVQSSLRRAFSLLQKRYSIHGVLEPDHLHIWAKGFGEQIRSG